MPETLSLDDVFSLSQAALTGSGVTEPAASIVADSVREAEADGIRNVGLAYLPLYCAHARIGKVRGDAVPEVTETGTTALKADAKLGFPHTAFVAGEDRFYAMAKQHGTAAFAIGHAYSAGVLGWFVDRIARQGLVGFCFANASPAMAPYGGTKPFFGTNPIGFGVPRPDGKPPLIIDQSSTATARINIILKGRAGEAIPEGWGLDADGNSSTDPDTVLNEGSMAPSGGYKGAAMALMVDLMAGGMTGANFSHQAKDFVDEAQGPPDVGTFLMAIDPEKFGGPDFAARAEVLFQAMLAQDGVRLPGDRRHAHRAEAERDGVAVPDDLLATLRAYAEGRAP